MAIEIGKPFALVRAGVYSDPDDPAAIIPDVYGDFTSGGFAGPCPAVRIDKTANVYAAAAHEVLSITQVYIGPVLQSSGYTVSLANNYQSQGIIATITFSTQPSDIVSWRGTGKKFPITGTLITNAIQQLANLLNTRAGFPSTIADHSSWMRAISLVDQYDFRTAFVINDERDVAGWIQEILFNVMGRAYLTGDDTIVVGVDDGRLISTAAIQPLAHIVASRDCVDGDDGVVIEGSYEHLVNALDLYYLWNWVTGAPASRVTTTGNLIRDALVSQNAHGEVRKSITLKGLRRTGDLASWAYVLFRRQSYADRLTGTRLSFVVEGTRLAHATIGDYIGFTWPYGPVRPGGVEYRNRLLQIVGVDVEPLRGGRVIIRAMDTGQVLDEGTEVLL